jgi:hypothetical protein
MAGLATYIAFVDLNRKIKVEMPITYVMGRLRVAPVMAKHSSKIGKHIISSS